MVPLLLPLWLAVHPLLLQWLVVLLLLPQWELVVRLPLLQDLHPQAALAVAAPRVQLFPQT